jgi:hypothetical protein
MARDVLAGMDVQMVDEQVALDVVAVREHADQLLPRLVQAADEVGVELDAIAGGEHRMLLDRGTTPRGGAQPAEPLAQLDGGRAMAQPETDEALHVANTLLRVLFGDTRDGRR